MNMVTLSIYVYLCFPTETPAGQYCSKIIMASSSNAIDLRILAFGNVILSSLSLTRKTVAKVSFTFTFAFNV